MRSILHILDRILSAIVRGGIRIYQVTLAPLIHVLCGPSAGCRYHPSCSQYALECFRIHPVHRAAYLAVRRILRCHPFKPGGYDPVPPDTTKTNSDATP